MNWDVLLPMCEFALNSNKSASMGYMPAYVLFGCEPVLPLEHAICQVTDCHVQLAVERVSVMQSTVQLVYDAILHAAVTMAKHTNCHRRPANIVIGGYAWLSTEHLKLAPGLSRKFVAQFFGPFCVITAVGAMSFHLELPS